MNPDPSALLDLMRMNDERARAEIEKLKTDLVKAHIRISKLALQDAKHMRMLHETKMELEACRLELNRATR